MNFDEFNLNNYQLLQFQKYYEFLVQENRKYNLTSIVEKEEVYIKHFYDSIKMIDIIDFTKISNLCDIGSGAGFPGIPLKIKYPHLKLTIIEPTTKKITFLKQLTEILKLSDIELINDRAEDEIINKREYYDVVTARAVASLPILLELTIPFLKVEGSFIALKGSSYQEELDISKTAMDKLNCKLIDSLIYELPNNYGTRAILNIYKVKPTKDIYPRNYAAIKKKHL